MAMDVASSYSSNLTLAWELPYALKQKNKKNKKGLPGLHTHWLSGPIFGT